MTEPWPDLSRTVTALEAYDHLVAKGAKDRTLEVAAALVAQCFAEDTADRNARDHALLMQPTPKRSNPENDCTVRRWVREFQKQRGLTITV